MTESSQVNINVSFEASRGTWMALSAAGAMMVVGILAAVTLGIGWMGSSFAGSDISYGLSEAEGNGGSFKYDSEQAGDMSGTGMILTAKILAIIGTVLAFVSMAVLVVSLFLRRFRLTLLGSVLAATTTILLILAAVFAPIGISQWHGDFEALLGGSGAEVGDLTVGAGLIIGIIAALFALGATVAGFLSLRDPVVT